MFAVSNNLLGTFTRTRLLRDRNTVACIAAAINTILTAIPRAILQRKLTCIYIARRFSYACTCFFCHWNFLRSLPQKRIKKEGKARQGKARQGKQEGNVTRIYLRRIVLFDVGYLHVSICNLPENTQLFSTSLRRRKQSKGTRKRSIDENEESREWFWQTIRTAVRGPDRYSFAGQSSVPSTQKTKEWSEALFRFGINEFLLRQGSVYTFILDQFISVMSLHVIHRIEYCTRILLRLNVTSFSIFSDFLIEWLIVHQWYYLTHLRLIVKKIFFSVIDDLLS